MFSIFLAASSRAHACFSPIYVAPFWKFLSCRNKLYVTVQVVLVLYLMEYVSFSSASDPGLSLYSTRAMIYHLSRILRSCRTDQGLQLCRTLLDWKVTSQIRKGGAKLSGLSVGNSLCQLTGSQLVLIDSSLSHSKQTRLSRRQQYVFSSSPLLFIATTTTSIVMAPVITTSRTALERDTDRCVPKAPLYVNDTLGFWCSSYQGPEPPRDMIIKWCPSGISNCGGTKLINSSLFDVAENRCDTRIISAP